VQNVLVTGSTGFVGTEVSQKLESNNFKVWRLDKNISIEDDNHFCIDVSSKEDINRIPKFGFDAIIHCAAQTDVRKSVEDPTSDLFANGLGTLNLVEFAAASAVKNFVYINSGGAIYGTEELPLSEKSPVAPSSPYGLTKFLGEEYVRILCTRYGIQWSSLALSNVYGDVIKNNKGVIYEFARKISLNEVPIIFGEGVTRDFVYIDDVVKAIEIALNKPTSCRVNISSNTETSIEEIFLIVARELKASIKPLHEASRFGEILRSRLDNSLAKKCLDWEPSVSISEGVAKSLSNFNFKPRV
jgi:UDP-glucose 4-epimerase